MRCKYCGMPQKSEARQLSVMESRIINHDIPEIKKSLISISGNLDKIADIPHGSKGLQNSLRNFNAQNLNSIFASDFYKTVAGKRFYESSIPELIKELRTLNKNLNKLIQEAPKTEENV